MDSLASQLLALRKAQGINQRELAQLSGVSRTTIQSIEGGLSSAAPSTLAKLSAIFGVTEWKPFVATLTEKAISTPIPEKTPPQAPETLQIAVPVKIERKPLTATQFLALCHDVLRQYKERGFSMLPLWTDYARCVWQLMDELEYALKAVEFSDEFVSYLKRNHVCVFSVPYRAIVLGLDLPGKGNYIPFGYGSYLRVGEAAYTQRDFCIADMLEKSPVEIKKGF